MLPYHMQVLVLHFTSTALQSMLWCMAGKSKYTHMYCCSEKSIFLYMWCGFESHLGQLTFSLKRRESEPSQVVLFCCLALFIVSQLLIIYK